MSSGEPGRTDTGMTSQFAAGALPPFSFTYGDTHSSEFLADWTFRREEGKDSSENVFVYSDPDTRLEIRCTRRLFPDFPAVDWVLTFHNTGGGDTPIIDDVQALDATWTREDTGEFVLHWAMGSLARREDFAPHEDQLRPRTTVALAPSNGRSSDTTAFPFFNIQEPGGGTIVAVGWSGQWAASLERDSERGLRVRAGMELTHLTLHPDETIRTPRILLSFWEGDDRIAGHNQFRQLVLTHYTPQKDGKPVTVPLSCSGSRIFEIANTGNEDNEIALAQRYVDMGLEPDTFWIDAGWFEGKWPNGVGNWFPRKDTFPNGLRPVADAVHDMGMGLIIWFEPERVHEGTWIDREHPEWVLRVPSNRNGLLDLGNSTALDWLTNHISDMIDREGIDVYRNDFNIGPLPFWRATDSEDRQGITEIRYIEGLYQFWDALLERHPGLLIDNCASGGRRIDLELISRSLALWRTDYSFEASGQQSHTYGLHLYVPTNAVANQDVDAYGFRSSMTSGMVLRWDPYAADFPDDEAKRLVDTYKRVRPFYYGDFYPLSAHGTADDLWLAYQFHREDMQAGMVLAFRRPESPYISAQFALRGLNPQKRYTLQYEDGGSTETVEGAALAEGLDVTLDEPRSSLLITYSVAP